MNLTSCLVMGIVGGFCVGLLAHAVGWSSGWAKRGALADEYERMIRPLERGLGFARARAGWATAEKVEEERKGVLLS